MLLTQTGLHTCGSPAKLMTQWCLQRRLACLVLLSELYEGSAGYPQHRYLQVERKTQTKAGNKYAEVPIWRNIYNYRMFARATGWKKLFTPYLVVELLSRAEIWMHRMCGAGRAFSAGNGTQHSGQ